MYSRWRSFQWRLVRWRDDQVAAQSATLSMATTHVQAGLRDTRRESLLLMKLLDNTATSPVCVLFCFPCSTSDLLYT